MVAFSRMMQSAIDDDELLERMADERARIYKAAVAARRKQIIAALALLPGGQGPQGKKRREESPFSWKDHQDPWAPQY